MLTLESLKEKIEVLEEEWIRVQKEMQTQYQTSYGIYLGKKGQLEDLIGELEGADDDPDDGKDQE